MDMKDQSIQYKFTFISDDLQKAQYVNEMVDYLEYDLKEPIEKCISPNLENKTVIECLRKEIDDTDILFLDLDIFSENIYFAMMIQIARFIEDIRKNLLVIFLSASNLFIEGPLKEFMNFKKWNNIYDFVLTPFTKNNLFLKLNYHLQYIDISKSKDARIKSLKEEQKKLYRYFSEDVVKEILFQSADHKEKRTVIKKATILFLDIRNFTSISEELSPDQVVELLDLLFTDIVDLIFSYKGSVNKFIGDSILATFGCPKSFGNDAENAVTCALQLISAIKVFNQVRPDFLKREINVGIGIASGRVFAGNVGSHRKMEYTVIGDTVNLASRLEELTKKINSNLVIDQSTKDLIKQKISFHRSEISNIRGKSEEVGIFYLDDNHSDQ